MKELGKIIQELEKQFGKGVINKMSDKPYVDWPVISTGSIGLDIALGIGGIPRGRITELMGQESSGKTTVALHILREAQRDGSNVVFVDAEHALDLRYAQAIGVDLERMYVNQPDNGEQALEVVNAMIEADNVSAIVIDSVAALTPKAEIDGEMGDAHMGLQARLMSQAMRKIVGKTGKNGPAIIFINQMRQKIGVVFGNPETTTGGNALKFYASVRIKISRGKSVTEDDVAVASHVTARVIKNKMAPPFRETEFDIVFGKGIDTIGEVIAIATELGGITKSGSWYYYQGEKIGQGVNSVREELEANPDMYQELMKLIRG